MNKYVSHYMSLIDDGLDIRAAYSLTCRVVNLSGSYEDFKQVTDLHDVDCKREFDLMLNECKKATAPTVTKEKSGTL